MSIENSGHGDNAEPHRTSSASPPEVVVRADMLVDLRSCQQRTSVNKYERVAGYTHDRRGTDTRSPVLPD